MRAVFCDIPDQWLQDFPGRHDDRWDEMWEGVLHVPPCATADHQDFGGQLYSWLHVNWAKPNGCRAYPAVNISDREDDWTTNYRIPDLSLLTADRFHINRNDFFFGAPLVVVEVRSPRDESYEKLPFYASLGVPEVWIIDRDSKHPEIYTLNHGQYVTAVADDDDWTLSEATGIRMKATDVKKLAIELAGDASTHDELPT